MACSLLEKYMYTDKKCKLSSVSGKNTRNNLIKKERNIC